MGGAGGILRRENLWVARRANRSGKITCVGRMNRGAETLGDGRQIPDVAGV